MLYNGEQIGDGSPPRGRHRRRPARGHDADRARACPRALAVIALAERGTMFDPGPVRLHGEDRRRPGDRRPARPRPAARRGSSKLVAERKGEERQRRDRDHARPRAPRGGGRRDPRGRRPDPLHHRRRRLGGAARGHRPAPASTCSGGSAARRRACSRPRRSSASAASCSAGCGRATTTSARRAIDAGYDLDEMLDVDRLVSGDDVFFAATGVTDGDAAPGRPLPRPRQGDHRVAGDALALGHRAHGLSAATTRRSCAR